MNGCMNGCVHACVHACVNACVDGWATDLHKQRDLGGGVQLLPFVVFGAAWGGCVIVRV